MVATDPKVGTEVKPGAKVTVIVSRGRAPVTVPNLVGKSSTDARTALAQLGLVLVETYKDTDQPTDKVLEPEPGRWRRRGEGHRGQAGRQQGATAGRRAAA